MKSEKIGEIQNRFFEALFDLEKTSGFTPSILEKPSTHASSRLQIYQQAYRARLSNSIHEDFYRVQALCTVESYQVLIEEFIKKLPSKFTNLAEYSESFVDFIKADHPDLLKAALMDWTEIKCENAFEPEDTFANNNFKESESFSLLLHPASLLVSTNDLTLLAYRTKAGILFLELSPFEIELYSFFSTKKTQDQIVEFIERNQLEPVLVTEVISEWVAKKIVYCT